MKISSKMHFIICGFLSLFFKSRTIKHILRLKASEKKEFLRKMINENIRQDVNEKKIYFSVQKQSFKFVESYNQLPCTVDTRKKRADLLEKNGFCDKHILLMGDDDLVSIELAARNFKYITVLDCDLNLLEKLKILTQGSQYPVTFFHVDLYEGLPHFLSKKFDVVFFDPPQNREDLHAFLDCALKALKDDHSSFYIMLNSLALGRDNVENLMQIVLHHGYINSQKLEFFNCYPLNRGQSFLLKTMSYFTHNHIERKKGINCRYYFTDCFEFKSNIV